MERISSVFPLPTLVPMLFRSYRFMFHTFLDILVDKLNHFLSFMLVTCKHFLLFFCSFRSFFQLEGFHLKGVLSCFWLKSMFWKCWLDLLAQFGQIQIVCYEQIHVILRICLCFDLSIFQASWTQFQPPLSKRLYRLIDNYRSKTCYQWLLVFSWVCFAEKARNQFECYSIEFAWYL